MRRETFTIAPRFNGPPGSGNGGYVAGVLACTIEGPSTVTLRAPPPLDTPLTLSSDGAHTELLDGVRLLAEADRTPFDLEAPPAPSLAEARQAEARYIGHRDHRYPTCFVCGGGRAEHDGLHLYTGAIPERGIVACAWTPADDLADAEGLVAPEFVHAALDCPTYWSLPRAGEMAALLARLTASIDAPRPRVGETLIVAAWPLHSEGRKHSAGAALYANNGLCLARAEALWIEPRT